MVLWRVISAAAERIAAADAPDSFEAAADRSVFFHRPDKVVAARRLEAALAADDGAESPLVYANEADEKQTGKTHDESQ